MFPDMRHGVFHAAIHLFARIEDVFGIEDLLGLFK